MTEQTQNKDSIKTVVRRTSTGLVLDVAVSSDRKQGRAITVKTTEAELEALLGDFHGKEAIMASVKGEAETDIYAFGPKTNIAANYAALVAAAPVTDVSRHYRLPSISESRAAGALKLLDRLQAAGDITPEVYIRELRAMAKA